MLEKGEQVKRWGDVFLLKYHYLVKIWLTLYLFINYKKKRKI